MLLVVIGGGAWLVFRTLRDSQLRARAKLRLEWPGVLALTDEGRDVYATVVLQALCDDVEPDIEDVTAQIDAADFASFEQSASRETHRHHATYMTAFYQRVALAAVLGSDPYRAGEEAMVEAALQELARAGAIPKRRRKLARRAMAGLVETSLATRASHGDAQLRSGLEARTAILDELQRLARPPSW